MKADRWDLINALHIAAEVRENDSTDPSSPERLRYAAKSDADEYRKLAEDIENAGDTLALTD